MDVSGDSPRPKITYFNSGEDHGVSGSAENAAETRLVKTAGRANVKRQHLGKLQHNKTIVVEAGALQTVVCGSTNFSWRGFYVQNNNALVLQGATAVSAFRNAFDGRIGRG